MDVPNPHHIPSCLQDAQIVGPDKLVELIVGQPACLWPASAVDRIKDARHPNILARSDVVDQRLRHGFQHFAPLTRMIEHHPGGAGARTADQGLERVEERLDNWHIQSQFATQHAQASQLLGKG